MADWRDSRGGHLPWRSSYGSIDRRRGGSVLDGLLPRLPVIGLIVLAVLVLLWIAGVVNSEGDGDSAVEEVDRALSRAGYAELQVTEEGGSLVLTGVVDTAEDHLVVLGIARSVEGVGELDDRLEAPEAEVTTATTGQTPSGPSSAADLQLQAQLASLLARDPIQFESASPVILDASLTTIDELAGLLAADPAISVEIAGHTDADGEEAANLELSQQRAQAVLDALVARGVAAERLSAVGFGETAPIASNETQEGKARNRRIELNVLPAGTTAAPTTTVAAEDATEATDEGAEVAG